MTGFSWRHVLYRLYDSDGKLLYIGRTSDLRARFSAHAIHQLWWHEVARCTVDFYPNLEALVVAEINAIRTEQPQHNITYNMNTQSSLVPVSIQLPTHSDSRRVYFGARLLTPDEHAQLQQLADRETGGNLSALVRRIVLGELGRQRELLSCES